ncbi:MAG: UDP-N-acetylmuramoyl-L-alanyl-D-glutamate--2,6-diaminopimelate ligase [Syntrophomonadaceae bacterium]|nr:UDP-N-acetylmuramoyl-L-alanyl-D-glutamate--2,6-diaminopimelate ligase [Syntrophomonadaceae bacterium]
MRLIDLLAGSEYVLLKGQIDTEIAGVKYDSRQVRDGDLFICISGLKTDGHQFAKQAIRNGAVAILAERELDFCEQVSLILTPDTRKAMARLASNLYQQPSGYLRVIGVTGTNGKTTTTHLIRAILEEAGKKTGIIGTLYARMGDYVKELGHTTPEALEIEEFISYCVRQKAEYIVMEVSSHALDLNRVDLILFNSAVFTNLTQDHLDFHHNMNSYRDSKAKLFAMIPADKHNFCVINADDAYGEDFKRAANSRCYTFGLKNEADVRAGALNISIKGSSFNIYHQNQEIAINTSLVGLFSVYNVLAAVTFALGEGINMDIIKSALEKVEGVAGRFEKVESEQDFTVIIDYAHTPDGLENILLTARHIAKHRLITVFGCGGDRDRTKRPLMGEIAARYSDFCIVTSDNPRSEEPENIIADIIPGLDKVEGSRYAIITDRREAIRHAIYLAKEGDLIIIAGKGHETYQLVKDQVLEFDDRKVAAEFLRRKEK